MIDNVEPPEPVVQPATLERLAPKAGNLTLYRLLELEGESDDELRLYGHIATSTNSTYIPETYQQATHSGEGKQWQDTVGVELATMDKYRV